MQNETKAQAGTLSADDLARRCPVAWNTFETLDDNARLGFELTKRLFREAERAVGDGTIPPGDLPLECEIPVEISGIGEDGLAVFASDEQAEAGAAAPIAEADRGPCRGPEDKPGLDRRYLDEHRPIAWNYRDMRDPYATVGYAAARAAIAQAVEAADGGEVSLPRTERVLFTLDTTHRAGGCTLVCTNGTCIHKPNDSSNTP